MERWKMRIDELKRIAEENDYELKKSLDKYRLTHKYCDNYITINGLCKNRLWISIPFYYDERDFNMIKAAVEFTDTPPEDREDEEKDKENRPNWMTRCLGEPVRDCEETSDYEVGRQENL